MIVVDASAVLAILEGEADAETYARAIAEADPPLISAATLLEVGIVMIHRHGPRGLNSLHRFLRAAGFRVEDVTPQQAELAIEAYAAFGKGRRGRAGLNYGDCFSYALAKSTGLPLLFKGRDFSQTDVPPALKS